MREEECTQEERKRGEGTENTFRQAGVLSSSPHDLLCCIIPYSRNSNDPLDSIHVYSPHCCALVKVIDGRVSDALAEEEEKEKYQLINIKDELSRELTLSEYDITSTTGNLDPFCDSRTVS